MIYYSDNKTGLRLGDNVVVRQLFRRLKGKVTYLPGVSQKNFYVEQGGVKRVGIRLDNGGYVTTEVDIEQQCLKGAIKFMQRGDISNLLQPNENPFEKNMTGMSLEVESQ